MLKMIFCKDELNTLEKASRMNFTTASWGKRSCSKWNHTIDTDSNQISEGVGAYIFLSDTNEWPLYVNQDTVHYLVLICTDSGQVYASARVTPDTSCTHPFINCRLGGGNPDGRMWFNWPVQLHLKEVKHTFTLQQLYLTSYSPCTRNCRLDFCSTSSDLQSTAPFQNLISCLCWQHFKACLLISQSKKATPECIAIRNTDINISIWNEGVALTHVVLLGSCLCFGTQMGFFNTQIVSR